MGKKNSHIQVLEVITIVESTGEETDLFFTLYVPCAHLDILFTGQALAQSSEPCGPVKESSKEPCPG